MTQEARNLSLSQGKEIKNYKFKLKKFFPSILLDVNFTWIYFYLHFLSVFLILISLVTGVLVLGSSGSDVKTTLVLVSDGPAAEFQSVALGIYDLVDFEWEIILCIWKYFHGFSRFNNHQVYVQRGGTRYLFYGKNSQWVIGDGIGSTSDLYYWKDFPNSFIEIEYFIQTSGLRDSLEKELTGILVVMDKFGLIMIQQ